MRLPYVPLIEDPVAGHQIVIRMVVGGITVSCNCLRPQVIEKRPLWTTDEALNAYREWHWVRGIDLYDDPDGEDDDTG